MQPEFDAAFVEASQHRSTVVASLRDWPKTTGQVALSCGLSLPHASRAIRQLVDRGIVSIDATGRQWVPLRSQLELLDEVERRFGDGSYRLIRELTAEAVAHYPSVRRYLMRAVPLRVMIEFALAIHQREFNHGRMEVEVSDRRAEFRHYDWLSSAANCATWLGSHEGAFALLKIKARIEKERCILQGDDFCGYLAEWND